MIPKITPYVILLFEGPLINSNQFHRLEKIVDASLTKGAKLVTGKYLFDILDL